MPNSWCQRSKATFVGCVGGSRSEDYRLFRKIQFGQIRFKHSYIFAYWIKCYGLLKSYSWLNSLTLWKVLVFKIGSYIRYIWHKQFGLLFIEPPCTLPPYKFSSQMYLTQRSHTEPRHWNDLPYEFREFYNHPSPHRFSYRNALF